MTKDLILTRLEHLTGNLRPTAGTTSEELRTLHRHLAEQLLENPEFTVAGSRLHHESTEHLEAATDLSDRFTHLEDLFERSTREAEMQASPLVFRRETAFHNNLLGNSVPEWGSGMAVNRSFGPFVDNLGLHIWFDFYLPVRMVRAYIKGNSSPALLFPVWGSINPRRSYRIEPGSVWIASDLIARTSSLQGYFTGLKVTGGSLELSKDAEVNSDQIQINPITTAVLHLELDQNEATATSNDAGFDASASLVKLPTTVTLQFNAIGSSLRSADASCTAFGSETEFKFLGTNPIWVSVLNQILVPYSVKAVADPSDTFQIISSDSDLCTFAGSAKINTGSGWLLPAAKIDPGQLGAAAGTGALCISLAKGINASWKGLKGGNTSLIHPGVIVEPGLVTVVDFFAENIYGKQKWVLWQNPLAKDAPENAPEHHSEITLTLGKAFPFIFVSSSKGSESILFFCGHKASFDRPVDANGSPFRIESTIALASILQMGASFQAVLLDNDLLFDGNPKKADAFTRCSIILRNALFSVSRPYSLFLSGELHGDDDIKKGVVAMMFGIHLYLPTLPDPYAASYTALLRDSVAIEFAHLRRALAAFVKWPNPAEVSSDDALDNPAYLYFRFAPLDRQLLFSRTMTDTASFGSNQLAEQPPANNFRSGVGAFNHDLAFQVGADRSSLPMLPSVTSVQTAVSEPRPGISLREQIDRSFQSGKVGSVIDALEANPLVTHIKDKKAQVEQTLNVALSNFERSEVEGFSEGGLTSDAASRTMMATRENPGFLFARDAFTLLDVSSRADQMGVSLGNAIEVRTDDRGDTNLRSVGAFLGAPALSGSDLPLQILNMDVVTPARNVRALTLPQISWEPIYNIPLPIEGPIGYEDLITVAPGLLIYDNDGFPTRIFSESPYLVPITPRSVTRHFLQEFHDKTTPRQLHSLFTLPFAMIAQASFKHNLYAAPDKNTRLSFNQPFFDQLRGGLQIKSVAPTHLSPAQRPSFPGWTYQLEDYIKWFFHGLPIGGSTLGKIVKKIFNPLMSSTDPKVPLERIEFSGYGASIFSNWFNTAAAVANVSQAKFDVLVGRTAHEVIQVRSIMYTKAGCVHVVRTITLMRSPNGYVFRSDSGWQPESDAFFTCDYKIDFGSGPEDVKGTYEFHPGAVKGISNVREIRDYPAGGTFKSSFSLKESGLPAKLNKKFLADWTANVFPNLTSLDERLPVELQAVVFDADVHFDNVKSGGVKDSVSGDFKVQTRKSLGYVQLSPPRVLIPPKILADLLNFQNGSLGGPVDCTIDIANSRQTMRLARVDLNPAVDGSGNYIFAAGARGSLILPPDGSWSVVKQQTDTGDVKLIEQGQTVPLIRANSSANFRIANPADVVQQSTSKVNFGVVQSTGTQKLLFDIPQFFPGQLKLKSSNTYFADAYKLLNSKGIFPNIANALALTNAEKEIDILGEGLMRMPHRNIGLKNLLPAKYNYPFINEPGILKIYAEYESGNGGGDLALGIDSGAPTLHDKWEAALSNMRIVVDLGPFERLMWVDGNFKSSSGLHPKYDVPHVQFGKLLDPVIEILQVLASLSGDDFDRGMDVGMSNSPDNWEYKFDCSKEIPVIKFPSPAMLTVNPNPPLKLEAGLKVGFYFNQVKALPTDVKQLVPTCGAYVDFYGRLQVQCFTLAVASIYAVGQVNLGIAADTKVGISLHMKFGFGAEIVVGLPVVANVAVLYMVGVEVGISSAALDVGAFLLFRGSAEICGGLVSVCIQIEAGGTVHRDFANDRTDCVAQVTFSIDITICWVIDIDFSDSWQETRQIA